jgi:hypothetical protein
MKIILKLTLVCLLLFAISSAAFAQDLSKQEKKEIKAKLKAFKKEPEKYKSMVSNYANSIKTRDTQIEEMKLELERVRAKARNDMEECQDTVAALQRRLAEAIAAAKPVGGATLPAGKAYGVQVGKFKFFDATQYFGTDKYLVNYKTAEGTEYVIIFFNDPKAAEACAHDIKKLGIKDAFVTKYIDGKRVPFDIRKDKE